MWYMIAFHVVLLRRYWLSFGNLRKHKFSNVFYHLNFFHSLKVRNWHLLLYTLFWALLFRARALRLQGFLYFLKYQSCRWPTQYICLHLQYWTMLMCIGQAKTDLFPLEFISSLLDIHWNMVILFLSYVIYPNCHFGDNSYFEDSLTCTLIFAMSLCLVFHFSESCFDDEGWHFLSCLLDW